MFVILFNLQIYKQTSNVQSVRVIDRDFPSSNETLQKKKFQNKKKGNILETVENTECVIRMHSINMMLKEGLFSTTWFDEKPYCQNEIICVFLIKNMHWLNNS